MGLFQQSALVKEFAVTILCAEFQAQGTLKVLGNVQTFINDEQKSVFALYNTSLFESSAAIQPPAPRSPNSTFARIRFR